MPPPVSSEDKFMTSSADELGVLLSSNALDVSGLQEDRTGTAKTVSRALKALVTGKTGVKKASRTL
jgi:hypothetical protein